MTSPKDDALQLLVLEALIADLQERHSVLEAKLRDVVAEQGHGIAVVLPSTGGRIANLTPSYYPRKPVPYVQSPSRWLAWAQENAPHLIQPTIRREDEALYLSGLAPLDRSDPQPEAVNRDGLVVDGVRFMWRAERTGMRRVWVRPTSERAHGQEMLQAALEAGELALPPLPVRWELDA
jgi:hypothetical protein